MRRNLKQLILAVALLAATGRTGAEVRETAALLRWSNGGSLRGELLESGSGHVRWASPLFHEDLIVDTRALDAIVFPRRTVQATETFRVGTVAGDVWTAELKASDEETFTFSSRRLGLIRVNRDTIYSIDRVDHPGLAFDGSQSRAWGVAAAEGPIKDLTYKVYDGSREWPRWAKGGVPDVSRITPVEEGVFAAGYLDIGRATLTNEFAMVFEGQLETTRASDYSLDLSSQDAAKLFVDGNLVGVSSPGRETTFTVKLGVGFHSLRLEYAKHSGGADPRLNLLWSGPGFRNKPLTGSNSPAGWRRGLGGHLHADRPKVSIFRRIELPEQFEVDLELSSTESPRFVLALGEEESTVTVSPKSLRLETWGNELVVVRDKVFEPVMALDEAQRDVRLRLVFGGGVGGLRVLDSAGHTLLELDGVQPAPGPSGVFLRNRGEDLTIRRLSVYRCSPDLVRQAVDPAKERVRLVDGTILYGRLFADHGRVYVVDQDGMPRNLDLDAVDRVVLPGAILAATPNVAELTYADGAVVRGRVEQANSEQVVLRTAFSDTPVTCSFAGAASLRFGPPVSATRASRRHGDELFYASGRLRGRVSFAVGESPLSWIPEGAVKPLRLGPIGGARIELSGRSLRTRPAFDQQEFPSVLHLKTGEIFPCRVSSYNENTFRFQSPFIKGQAIDAAYVKALEFERSTRSDPEERASSQLDDWLEATRGRQRAVSFADEPANLDRVLMIPRFNRDNPPNHLVLAKTGDIKRGNLVGIKGQRIQFESKLREVSIPIDRVTGVVCISEPEEAHRQPAAQARAPAEETVQATLWDGSVLLFVPVSSRDGKLTGRSSIYGEMAIPIESIRRLIFGGFEREKYPGRFAKWVGRPAKEPEFSKPSVATIDLRTSERPSFFPAGGTPRIGIQSLDAGEGAAASPPAEDGSPEIPSTKERVPDLGQVRVDPADRSLRFPVSINQRSGPVEYALVTDRGKTHESVFRTDAAPLHIHLGLLLLGGTPVYVPELPTNPTRQLPGEPLLIEIVWTEGEVELRKPLGEFILTTDKATTLPPGPWVYNGSVMIGNGLAAQTEGSLVALYLDPAALINNPRPSRANDELHRANPRAFPADTARLEMSVRLAKDQPRRAVGEHPRDVAPLKPVEAP